MRRLVDGAHATLKVAPDFSEIRDLSVGLLAKVPPHELDQLASLAAGEPDDGEPSELFVRLQKEGVADEVVAKLKVRLESLRVGDPLDKNTDVGAINSKPQLETISKYFDIARDEGLGVFESSCDLPSSGYWCKPSFFTGVQANHTVAREEIVGPVLAIQTFRTPEEAITRANNSPYGLAAGVWTDKGSKIFEIAGQLKAGIVWLNTYNQFDPTSPFGGYKESGFGREGGRHGLAAYLK